MERVAPSPTRPHLAWFDLARGVAALEVMLYHLTDNFNSLIPGARQGWTTTLPHWLYPHEAVIVFFLLSGYLVGGSALQQWCAGTFSGVRYVAARLARMWTVLVPALLITLVADSVAVSLCDERGMFLAAQPFYPVWWSWDAVSGPETFVGNLIFLQMTAVWQFGSNLSLWSLSYEFWFYMILPCLLFYHDRKNVVALAAALAIIAWFIVFAKYPAFDRAVDFCFYLIVWLGGAVAGARIPQRSGRWAVGGLIVGVACLTSAGWLGWSDRILYGVVFRGQLLHDLLTVPGIGGLLVAVTRSRLPCPAPRLWYALANISFSVYALHLPLILLAIGVMHRMSGGGHMSITLQFIIIAAFVSAIVLAVWWLTERNTAVVRRWLEPKALHWCDGLVGFVRMRT